MLKRIFVKDWKYKIAAVILAILLKLYFISPQNQVTEIVNVPIALTNIPRTMAVISPLHLKTTTKASVVGPRQAIENYKNNPKEIKVSLAHLATKKIENQPIVEKVNLFDVVSVPSGIEVDELEPRQLEVVLDRNLRKNVEVDVKTNIIGAVADGYEITNISVTPSSVTITGAATELAKIKKLDTQKIDVSQYTNSMEEYVDLEISNDAISYDIWRVRVNVDIAQRVKDKEFADLPVKVVADNGDALPIVAPSVLRARLRIREKDVDNIKAEDINLIVNTSLLPPGEHFVAPQLEKQDERFSLIWTMPRTVSVKVK